MLSEDATQTINSALLSIIIETKNSGRNDPQELFACLDQIDQQSIGRSNIEVIVVIDPLEHPDFERILKKRTPAVKLVLEQNAHYYRQKNLGANIASTPIVAFLDSDCAPLPTWADAIVSLFEESDHTLAAIQGPVRTQECLQGFAFLITSFGQVQGRKRKQTHMLTGNNCAFRRDEFLASPFIEDKVFHGPEVAKVAEIEKQGRKIILEPAAANQHFFEEGLLPFLSFSRYWGWCFLDARFRKDSIVPYTTLFRTLGPMAPFALIPAKALIDTIRTLQVRQQINLSIPDTLVCIAFLWSMSPIVGWGGLLRYLGLPVKTPSY